MKAGALAILRVDFVLSGGVRAVSNKPILWTGFPAKIRHQGPIFSYSAVFLFFLWTFEFKSKGFLSTNLGVLKFFAVVTVGVAGVALSA